MIRLRRILSWFCLNRCGTRDGNVRPKGNYVQTESSADTRRRRLSGNGHNGGDTSTKSCEAQFVYIRIY